jgi:hypothetical protein
MPKITSQRWKPKDRWTAAEHLAYHRDATRPESDEFLELKAKVLADAGLEDDASTSSKPLTKQSVQEPSRTPTERAMTHDQRRPSNSHGSPASRTA